MVFKRRDKPPLLAPPARGAAAAARLAPGDRVPRAPGPAAARHPAPHRASASRSGSSPRFTPVLRRAPAAGRRPRQAAARQHRRLADRHLRRQPADLPADRLGLARARPAHPRLRRQRPRLRAPDPTPSRSPPAGSGRACMSLVGRGDSRSGAGSSPSSTTSSGPTSSAACCRGSPRRSPSYWLLRPLVAAYQARRRERMLARAHDRLARGELPG